MDVSSDNSDIPKEHNNKLVAITGGILIGLSLAALSAFLLIGYLAVPLGKEKSAWIKNEQMRKTHLDEILNEKKKTIEDVIKEKSQEVKSSNEELLELKTELDNLSSKRRDYDVLNLNILNKQKDYDSVGKNIIERNEKFQQVNKLLDEENNRLFQLSKNLSDVQVQIEKSTKQSLELESKYREAIDVIEKVKIIKPELEETTLRLKKTKEEISIAEISKSNLVQESNTLIQKVLVSKNELIEYENLLVNAQKTLSQRNKEIGLLNQELLDKRTHLAEANANIKFGENSKKLLEEINKARHSAQNELTEINSRIKIANDVLNQSFLKEENAKNKLSHIEYQIKDCEGKITKLKTVESELNVQIELKKQNIGSLQ